MSEFRALIFKKKENQPKDHRFIQMTLLLAICLLVAFVFDPSPMRNILLFVIISWGLLLHFSYYVFNKENIERNIENDLVISPDGIRMDNKTLAYEDIDQIDIYVGGTEDQLKSNITELAKSNGQKNLIRVSHNEEIIIRYFQLHDESHFFEMISAINGLNEAERQRFKLERDPSRIIS
ncbi:MAG: hypothetical protein HRT61_16170 [Ekhidna sp.]|nr:hypothetical protein [Ekhidna sp.]